MVKIKKINVLSFAKLHTLVWGFAGLIAGILYSFGGAVIDALVSIGWVTTTETPGLSYGTVLAFGALFGMPILFAICGFAVGIIVAMLYNILAKWFGVEIDL